MDFATEGHESHTTDMCIYILYIYYCSYYYFLNNSSLFYLGASMGTPACISIPGSRMVQGTF